ncbi:MAG TPA: Wzz/FepE/Etk N-terminal domain-containing protein [Streptosporangiaceae bacterium]|nr:Wzz/FepE/Etk N-terminal domain-containing protein [Streptosporangiaceae bacterium]
MSQETLDLRRSIRIMRRRKFLIATTAALGLLVGGAYAVLTPPKVTSTALVLLSQSSQAAQTGAAAAVNGGLDPYTATQEVIAKSNPVLLGALPHVSPAMTVNQLTSEVSIGAQTPYLISVSVTAKSGAEAAANANAVAESYINYIGSPSNPGGEVQAQLLQSAANSTASGLSSRIVIYAIIALVGAIFGMVIGIVIALATSRSDRRLRARDEIANSIGVPVVASFPVGRPSNPGEWTRLFEDYKPGAMHSLQLRKALQQLEMEAAEVSFSGENNRWSFTVLSLSADPGALALGPQLATFAASQGISTALVVAPQQDAAVTASLRTACAAPPNSSKWPGHLQVLVSDQEADVQHDAKLTVVVGVVDGRNPQAPGAMRTGATLVGVSAGVATADQLARVAVSAVSDGREITGILVANPDPADTTTGRLPQLGRRGLRRMPTRVTGMATEIRR